MQVIEDHHCKGANMTMIIINHIMVSKLDGVMDKGRRNLYFGLFYR